MNTRPQGLNAIDNVAGDKDVQHQRKRIGRPPKMKQQSEQNDHTVDEIIMEIDNKMSTSSLIDTSANECRRSSRKKIIKFDVREVLNKNRKPHKVQIEARIDSNVIFNNVSSYSADITQCSFMDKSVEESAQTSVSDVNITTPFINREPAKRGRPPRLSLPNKIPHTALETQSIKRGRGRPPKCRKDSQIPETTKLTVPAKPSIVNTSTSTPVSVLLKKLKLSHVPTFQTSKNNYEKLTAVSGNNTNITTQVENITKVATSEEELLEEEHIILELSSSSSSKNENSVNSSQSSLHSTHLLDMGTNCGTGQRNFAAVSVLSRDETEAPEFIVAAVEEVIEQNDREIEYEVVNEESETISDDSVILMLDLKDEEVNRQHDLKSSPETVSSIELVESHDILTQSQLEDIDNLNMSEVLENRQESYNNDHM